MIEIKYKSWEEITLKKFNELEKIITDTEMSDIDKNTKLIAVLCDCSISAIEELPYEDYLRLNKECDFIRVVPTIDVRDNYTVNGVNYKLCTDFKTYTTAQFIDFQNMMKQKGVENKHNIVAIFLIPEGCTEYAKGYDVGKVADDVLNHMSILDVDACMLFFSIVYNALTIATLQYSKKKMKKILRKTKEKEKREIIEKGIEQTEKVLHLLKNGIG